MATPTDQLAPFQAAVVAARQRMDEATTSIGFTLAMGDYNEAASTLQGARESLGLVVPRTCEANLARRAWASAYHRQKLAQRLLTLPTIQKVHGREMRKALESTKPQAIAAALPALQAEVERCQYIAERVGSLQTAA
jgi:hypothetical protein